MEIVDHYFSIFKRKSIKRYDLTPLDDYTLKEISNHLSNLEPLYDHIELEIKILSLSEVKVKKKKKEAPHYLAVFSKTKSDYYANVGFILQQMDLFFSEKGIGSCWQGSPKPYEDSPKDTDLEFIIVMAFGKPKDHEPIYRDISEFERKPLSEISTVKDADELLEAARCSPSSGNVQPWFFSGNKNLINAYTSKEYPKKDYTQEIIKKYNTISLGIALYHLKIAANHFGKKNEILWDEKAHKNVPEGYDYVASLKVK